LAATLVGDGREVCAALDGKRGGRATLPPQATRARPAHERERMNDLSPEQVRAEAERFDKLVQRHARHRVIGAAPEDHVALPLTMDKGKLSEKDRRSLAELFRKQSEIYREIAESLTRKP
jgi:hypothetical protein